MPDQRAITGRLHDEPPDTLGEWDPDPQPYRPPFPTPRGREWTRRVDEFMFGTQDHPSKLGGFLADRGYQIPESGYEVVKEFPEPLSGQVLRQRGTGERFYAPGSGTYAGQRIRLGGMDPNELRIELELGVNAPNYPISRAPPIVVDLDRVSGPAQEARAMELPSMRKVLRRKGRAARKATARRVAKFSLSEDETTTVMESLIAKGAVRDGVVDQDFPRGRLSRRERRVLNLQIAKQTKRKKKKRTRRAGR